MRTFISERGRSGGRLDRSDQHHARRLLGVGMHGGCSAGNSVRGSVLGVSSHRFLTAQPQAAHTDYGSSGNDARGRACGSAGMASVFGVDARGGDVQRSGDGGRARGWGLGAHRRSGRGVGDWGHCRRFQEQRTGSGWVLGVDGWGRCSGWMEGGVFVKW
jgi:hypothetical protein